ncbi:MAG: MATE family efflux transporter [Clostridia bacterium]|nr:MATE family efflux transporter [Clostridia bacterium]
MDKTEAHYKKMTQTPVMKLVIMLGIPTTISMLITNVYNLVDTYFVGSLGESQQGAVGVLFTLQCIIQAFSFMLGHGSGAFVSKALAEKDVRQATKYASTAFFSGAAIGLVLCVLGLSFLKPFAIFLGSTDTILPYAIDYGTWVCLSCPFVVCSFILNNILRYEGKASMAMIGLVSGGIINIFGDWLFIRVFEMGVYGAGLATAISQFISFGILVTVHLKSAQSKLSLRAVSGKVRDYFDICKVGLPSMLRQGLTSVSSGILNNLARPFGDAAIAALSVINRYSSLVLCVGLGIGQGFQPVASFNHQAKEYTRVKKALLGTMTIGIALMGTMAIFGFIFPGQIVSVFQKSPEVIRIGKFGLRAASVGSMVMPVSVCANMLYQSIRQAGTASFLSMLRSGLAMIPTMIILSRLWGLNGILLSQPVADVISSLICLPFILHFVLKTPNTALKPE